tara:strand:+ start:15961 stop:16263 length:303 start_codon:yes stop_codon:yes gene_type:complete
MNGKELGELEKGDKVTVNNRIDGTTELIYIGSSGDHAPGSYYINYIFRRGTTYFIQGSENGNDLKMNIRDFRIIGIDLLSVIYDDAEPMIREKRINDVLT